MIGLGIAALIVAYYYFVGGMALTSAMMVALTFVWWFTSIFLGVFLFLLTIGGSVIGGHAGGGAGAVGGGVIGILVGVLAAVIPSSLILGGVYIMYHTLDGHVDFSTVPQPDFLIGAFMYGIALLMSMVKYSSSKSSD